MSLGSAAQSIEPSARAEGRTEKFQATVSRNYLLSRRADFWLMGGASLVVWVMMMIVTSFAPSAWARDLLLKIGLVATVGSFLVFQPHFIYTYRMAYGRGMAFVFRRWPQLIGVPLLLISVYATALFFYGTPVQSGILIEFFPEAAGFTYGRLILSVVLSSMFLMLGWHHSKQTFGCMMVYRKFDNYPVSRSQRRLLLGSLYSLWAVNVVVAQANDQLPTPFYGLPLYTPKILESLRVPVISICWLLVFWSLYQLVFKNWRDFRKRPSANFLVPLIAILLWWAPPFYQRDFYIWFSTVFHALQYWPFAFRYEQGRATHSQPAKRKLLKLAVWGIVLGALCTFLPMAVDVVALPNLMEDVSAQVGFFLIAFQTSLNIHHYFLDSVIWRLDQPEIRNFIVGDREGVRTA